MANDPFPTIYRIDRIRKLEVLEEKFHIPTAAGLKKGNSGREFSSCYGGKLRKVRFWYKGSDIDAVLDRLPTA